MQRSRVELAVEFSMLKRPSLCALALAAATVPPIAPAVAQTPPQANATADVVRGNTEFAASFYGRLRAADGNVVFSPASLSLALGMTYAGARGDTADAMASALHFAHDESSVDRGFQALLAQWSHPSLANAYQLDVANRLYGERSYQFAPGFVAIAHDAYGAPLERTDFVHGAEAARVRINTWVSNETHNRINDLIPSGAVDPQTRLVLVNAIYFHGLWDTSFRRADTHDAAFHVTPHAVVNAPMMHQSARFPYAHVGGVQVVELPYRGGDLAFDLVVPDAVDGIAAVEGALDAATITRWTSSLSPETVHLSMPRFRAETTAPASRILRDLGMGIAFDPTRANFSGMTAPSETQRLSISDVVHKAFIEVNEEGTEAAAATGVVMVGTAFEIEPTVTADHPFLFVLRDRRSSAIFFMGRVSNPRSG